MSTLAPILIANPDAEAVYCGYQFVDHLNNPLPQKEARDIPSDQLFQALVDGNFLVPESILVRKSCYEKVGLFDRAFRACEDMDMWLRITSRYKVLGSTKLLTRHRILPNSMSTDPTRQTQNRLAVIKKHFGPEPANESEWTDAQRRAYGQAYLASAVEYLQAQRRDSAYESFSKMAHIYPGLLANLNTFYELGCGEQPKGHRGDFASLNIEQNAWTLIGLLDRFFSGREVPQTLLQYKQSAYYHAWFALGLLGYGANQHGLARGYFVRAIQWMPRALFKRQFFVVFLKSFLGGKILQWLRNKKRD
jgi:tetratricopeptide (TPR) repeat protein